jgi:L-fuculose-phosphate aldolase
MTTTAEIIQPLDQMFLSHLHDMELSPEQNVALLHRMLWREGYNDRIAGHISARTPSGSLLCTPYGLGWDEVRASDVLTVDRGGRLLKGHRDVPIAITLHLAAHEMRPDIHVVVHHHPRWATAWAAAHRVPPIYDQLGSFGGAGLMLYTEFLGGVDDWDVARRNIAALEGAPVALLANHGVLVLAEDVVRAHLRSVVVEHRCALAADVEQIGGGQPVQDDVARAMGSKTSDGWPLLFEAMARREIDRDPSVLE